MCIHTQVCVYVHTCIHSFDIAAESMYVIRHAESGQFAVIRFSYQDHSVPVAVPTMLSWLCEYRYSTSACVYMIGSTLDACNISHSICFSNAADANNEPIVFGGRTSACVVGDTLMQFASTFTIMDVGDLVWCAPPSSSQGHLMS